MYEQEHVENAMEMILVDLKYSGWHFLGDDTHFTINNKDKDKDKVKDKVHVKDIIHHNDKR